MEEQSQAANLITTICNYLLILVCMSFFTVLITAVNLSKSFTSFERIVLVILAVIFVGYTFEKEWKYDITTNLWNKIVGNEYIAVFLGIMPWVLIYVWAFALVQTPHIIWTWLLKLSMLTFFLPFIINGFMELNKVMNKQRQQRKKGFELFLRKIIRSEVKK